MFFTVIPYYISPAVWLVAKKLFAGRLFEFPDNISRESVGVGRLRFAGYYSGDLPVSDRGILSGGALSYSGIGTDRIRERPL